jgi:hypothetical protein
MTSSLSNFFYSLIAGGVVVSVIAAAVIFVSKTDRLKRS